MIAAQEIIDTASGPVPVSAPPAVSSADRDQIARNKGGVLLVSPQGDARLLGGEEMLLAFAGPRDDFTGRSPGAFCLVEDVVALGPSAVAPVSAMAGIQPAYAQGPDGVVWYDGPQGLCLVERGQLFQLPFASHVQDVTAILPGEGAALIASRQRWFLVTHRTITNGGTLENLIRDNREAVAHAFTAPHRCYVAQPAYVQADRDGNIWLARPESHQLQVLAGDEWIDARPALTTAGAPLGRASVVFPIGDLSRMYIAEPWHSTLVRGNSPPAADYPIAFLASCDNGRLSFVACPGLAETSDGRPIAWSDSRSDLWLNVRNEQGSGELVAHLRQTGLSSQASGRLLAIDADDHPWVYVQRTADGEMNPAPLQLLVNNKPHPLPGIPFVDSTTRVLPSPRRDVYVTTTLGLQMLRGAGTAENPTFAIGPRFENASGAPLITEGPSSSDLLTGVGHSRRGGFELQIFRLPR